MQDKIINANARYVIRQDTLDNWKTANPVLLDGELVAVKDGKYPEVLKRGDGVTAWIDLPWWPEGMKNVVDVTYTPNSTNAQSGKAVKEAVEPKLDKPEIAPEVGKILKVKSVNEDGTFICEWADENGSAVDDVQIDGESIVENGIAKLDKASANNFGLIKVGNGLFIGAAGNIGVAKADSSAINSRNNNYNPIVPAFIDYAVKAAMCDGKGATWTADEQSAARDRMGILIDQSYTPNSTNAQSGKAVAQAVNGAGANGKYTGNRAFSAETLSLDSAIDNVFDISMRASNMVDNMDQRVTACELNYEYNTVKYNDVEQTVNTESDKPVSSVAVAAYINNVVGDIETLLGGI